MEEMGFERTPEPSDCTLVLSWKQGSDWFTVYDESSDSGEFQDADELASALSREFGAHAVSNIVLDIDLLYMRQEERTTVEMDFLLQAGSDKKQLADIWQQDSVVAEEKLAALGEIYGWDMDAAGVGYSNKRELYRRY
ncbi:hypothetical protein ACFPPD_23115 [Cohnella suwonensis]|uniref:Uncharacterized protein n=1 Tax=Cohnella suwonensis TaxID=696072 RepID=A0ABW0M419_9BACL